MNVAELFATLGLKPDESSWNRGTQLIEKAKGALGGLAAAFAAKKIEDGVMAVVDYGSKLNDMAQKTGLGAGALQELGYVAEQNSSSLDDLAGGVKKLSHGLDEATQKGTGPAADALRRLGLSINDPNFKNAMLDDKVQSIATKLSAFPDGVTKTALAMDLFGRSGADLIPTLNDLGQNGDALRDKFRSLHRELSDEEVKAFDTFGDTINDVKGTTKGLWTEFVTALIPTLQKLADGFLKWYAANKVLISQKIVAFAEKVGAALNFVADAIGAVVDFVSDHGDLVIAFLVALGVYLGIIAVESVIAFLPVLALIAAVALLAYGVKKLIDYAPQIKKALGAAFDWVKGKILGVWNGIKSVGHAVYQFFYDIGRTIRDAFQAVVDWFSDKIDWVVDKYNKAKDLINQGDVHGGLTKGLQNAVDDAAANAPGEVAVSPSMQGGANNATTNNNVSPGAVQVTINGGDPQQVKSGVIAAMSEFWDGQMRDAHAATGGADQ